MKGVKGKVRDHRPRQVHGHRTHHLFRIHKHLSGSLHPVMQPQQFGVTDPGVARQLDGFQVGEEAREVGLQALEMVVSQVQVHQVVERLQRLFGGQNVLRQRRAVAQVQGLQKWDIAEEVPLHERLRVFHVGQVQDFQPVKTGGESGVDVSDGVSADFQLGQVPQP